MEEHKICKPIPTNKYYHTNDVSSLTKGDNTPEK